MRAIFTGFLLLSACATTGAVTSDSAGKPSAPSAAVQELSRACGQFTRVACDEVAWDDLPESHREFCYVANNERTTSRPIEESQCSNFVRLHGDFPSQLGCQYRYDHLKDRGTIWLGCAEAVEF